MSKITDGGGLSYSEIELARRNHIAARTERWNKFEDRTLRNFVLPLVMVAALFYSVVKVPPEATIPEEAYIGFMFLVSLVTYALGVVGGFVTATLVTLAKIGLDRWRRRQSDRILDLLADERLGLVRYAYGGEKFLEPRVIVLNEDVVAWAKATGIKMRTLSKAVLRHPDDPQVHRPLVWFKHPTDAVAFKMRWY